MRLIVLAAFLAVALGCGPQRSGGTAARPYDLVIRNGDVIDGTGAPMRRADVAIAGDRIVAIGNISAGAARTIDASGRVVAPGFIDVQGQSGTSLLTDGNGESHIRQGITTEIIGEADTPALWSGDQLALFKTRRGFDWSGFGGYLTTL